MKKFFLLFALCCFLLNTNAQSLNKQEASIHQFVDSYNNQDFAEMKKNWIFLGKMFLTKKSLKNEYGLFFAENGKLKIDTISHYSDYDYTLQLSSEKKPNLHFFWAFYFDSKQKIQGVGTGNPNLIYPKNQRNNISILEKHHQTDSLLKKEFNSNLFNGCVLILDHNQAIYQQCYGEQNMEQKIPLNDSTIFEIASCSKQFTAMGILQLYEQNKLNFSDSIQQFIPEFPYHNITIENLLTHSSGLPDYMSLINKYWDKTKFATNQDALELFIKHHPNTYFVPNENFEYSNTGYLLLAIIIERISMLSYADYMKKYIFEPLQMNHSLIYNTRRSKKEIIPNFAIGYIFSNSLKKYVNVDSLDQYHYIIPMDELTGDGKVHSSINDLIKWENALFSNSLVKAETMQKAYTKHKLNNGKDVDYGFGHFIRHGNNSEFLVYHTGGWPGYICMMMRFPELEKSIIILTNNSYDGLIKLSDQLVRINL